MKGPWMPAFAGMTLWILAGCADDMRDQPRYEPLEPSPFFEDGRSARTPVAGTVARGQLKEDKHFYTGMVNGKPAERFPFPVTLERLKRGRERYDIHCSACHDRAGQGKGMIVRRGFSPPPSLHIERLRNAPPGHFFDVITRGIGRMAPYNSRVSAEDRWNIAAYIRALQLSQYARVEDIPEFKGKQLLRD